MDMIIFFMRHKDRVTVWNIQYATAETLTPLSTVIGGVGYRSGLPFTP